ncbi:MAG: lytic transglycosylase domain-containing protein [Agathobacter sp.]|nr:lytic transglycosylase domain-containing protein [Agathobacter sp.]
MSIKVLSSIDEALLSRSASTQSAGSVSSIEVSFADALASAQDLLASDELDQAQKNAIRAVTVDAAVDAIRQSGGYGLSLDSALAKSLGLNAPAGLSGDSATDTSSIQVESAADAARRTANVVSASDTSAASDSVSTSGTTSDTHASASVSADNAAYFGDEFACSDTLEEYFEEASSTYEVDLKLLKSIALVESDFNPDCTSSAGAMGVMQLMPETAKELGVEHPYDAYENIMGGAKLISQLLDKYDGDIALAAAAYNAGSGAVAKYNGIPPYTETQNYVKKVLSHYNS